jgi:hypothetical protein
LLSSRISRPTNDATLYFFISKKVGDLGSLRILIFEVNTSLIRYNYMYTMESGNIDWRAGLVMVLYLYHTVRGCCMHFA